MWTVMCPEGAVAEFSTREEAENLAKLENEDDPGNYWVVFVYTYR